MKFSKAPQSGGKAPRARRACEKFGPSAENLGSNPHFGAILAFFGRRKGYFLRAQLTPGPSFLSLCCAVLIPLAAYTHSIKSSDNNSRFLSAGFVLYSSAGASAGVYVDGGHGRRGKTGQIT